MNDNIVPFPAPKRTVNPYVQEIVDMFHADETRRRIAALDYEANMLAWMQMSKTARADRLHAINDTIKSLQKSLTA